MRHELQKQSSDHEKQMSDLQMKLAKLESFSSPDLPTHLDLDLKITTISKYLEQLVFSLKLGIQDTLHQIDKDVKLLKSCYLWNDPSTNYCSLSDHQTQHAHPISINKGAPCLNQELTAVAIPHYYPKTQQFHCDICGYRLNTPSQLSEHIMCVHDVTGSFQSNICNNAGLRESDPNSHMIEHAQQEPYFITEREHHVITPALVHCAFCDNTFTDMRELNVHTAGAHGDMLAPHDAGAETDHSIGIDPHSPVHANHEYEEEIFIPQVDGVVDMPVDKF